MKKQIKILGIALLTVLASSALSASLVQASAPRWKVKGAFLEAGKTKVFTGINTTEIKITSAALNKKAPAGNCDASGTIIGSGATQPGTATFTLICTGVVVVGSEAKCIVKSPGQVGGTIKTENLKGTLVWLNEKQEDQTAGLKVAADSAGPLLKLEISGAECPVANEKPYLVSGEVIASLLPVGTETELGSITFAASPILSWWNNSTPRVKQSIEANRLKLGKEGGAAGNATISGQASLELSPKEKVGVFAG